MGFFSNWQPILGGIGSDSSQPFGLQDIKDFPYTEYMTNYTRYVTAVDWFSGSALKPKQGEQDKYPVKINPLNATCLKHAYALFGDVREDGRPLVVPKFVIDAPKESRQKQRTLAKAGESALNYVWWENFGRSIMSRNAVTSQIFGGSIFTLRHVPWEKDRNVPIKIERISPEHFLCFPKTGDEFRLSESWQIIPMRPSDAKQYGVTVDEHLPCYWVEKWTPDEYHITINGKPLSTMTHNGVEIKSQGDNEFGFVPSVYIPHIRTTSFYGDNNVDHLVGLVKEINLRYADIGDAVNADAHSYVGYRNVQGKPTLVKLAPNLYGIDLGGTAGITGNENEPDMFEVRKGATASAVMTGFTDDLMAQYRRDAFLPAVADGEDEGSQRSAETLVTRMWPLISHINTERNYWSSGMDLFNQMLLRVMEINGYKGITKEHLEMRMRQEWSPILPKDRTSLINELVNRAANDLGSPQTLLEKAGDVEDIDQEMELMKEWKKIVSEVNKPPVVPGALPAQDNKGGSGIKNPEQPRKLAGGQPPKKE